MKTKGFRDVVIKDLLHRIETTWCHQAMVAMMMEEHGLSRKSATKHYLNVLLAAESALVELSRKYANEES
jgi:hypothetical protein